VGPALNPKIKIATGIIRLPVVYHPQVLDDLDELGAFPVDREALCEGRQDQANNDECQPDDSHAQVNWLTQPTPRLGRLFHRGGGASTFRTLGNSLVKQKVALRAEGLAHDGVSTDRVGGGFQANQVLVL
jgi:hypothetical protein